MAFYGTDTYAIDHKGRVSVPVAMRRVAGRAKPLERFILVRGFEGCCALYSPDNWQRFEARLLAIPIGNSKGRAFARAYLMDATPVTVDGQGRITIPPALMGHAGLGKDAVLHGQIDRIEIWNPERLRAVVSEASGQLERLADEVLGG
jgi:MraZ protein